MRNDQIFVLLLVILLPMSGCFDGAVGDAEGTDDASENGDTSGGEGTASSTQSRTWYSSGGTYQTYWDDGHYSGMEIQRNNGSNNYIYMSANSQRCLSFGPYYDSSTGELLGERCNEWGYPETASDWNLTDCTDNGGEAVWSSDNFRNAPVCLHILRTINTSSGEALLIYQASGINLRTTCNGVSSPNQYYVSWGYSSPNSYSVSDEYNLIQGSALDCTHEIYRTSSYVKSSNSNSESIWSIVYAIQDTTVV